MGWSVYPAQQAFASFRTEWDSLNQKLYGNHPLFDGRFVAPLIKYFATDNDNLVVHRSQNVIDGMALLQPRHCGVWSSFLPSQMQISPVLFKPLVFGQAQSLFDTLPKRSAALEWLCQDPLYSPCFVDHCTQQREAVKHATTTSIHLQGEFSQYWGTRSKNLRRNVSRYLSRLQRDGLVPRLDTADAPQTLSKALASYGDIETSGWKGKAGTAIHPDNSQGQFYHDVLLGFAQTNQALVYELRLNSRLVSSRLCIASDNMAIVLKTTYDEACAEYAPGWLLLYMLLETEFQRRCFQTIEFYTNASHQQLSWATHSRAIEHIILYRTSYHRASFATLRKLKALARKALSQIALPRHRVQGAHYVEE